MNYELAKELKDAGYPQNFPDGCDSYVDDNPLIPEALWEHIAVPTLSELIEACGEDFCCLYRVDRTEDGKGIFWSAGYNNLVVNHLTGSTPEEAVARLWLALNKTIHE